MPPTPRARSRAREPVGMDSICRWLACPSRMIAPSPYRFSMFFNVVSSARKRLSSFVICASWFCLTQSLPTDRHAPSGWVSFVVRSLFSGALPPTPNPYRGPDMIAQMFYSVKFHPARGTHPVLRLASPICHQAARRVICPPSEKGAERVSQPLDLASITCWGWLGQPQPG
jgi:hypothetical protein